MRAEAVGGGIENKYGLIKRCEKYGFNMLFLWVGILYFDPMMHCLLF